jgi:hypothetical protein
LDSGLEYSPTPASNFGYFNFSFDDNYQSWKYLAKLNFSVTMYLNTLPFEVGSDIRAYLERIDKPQGTLLMDKQEDIKFLLDSGHLFGFHTHSHINIAKTDITTLTEDISRNREYFVDLGIETPVNQLAIPFGMLKYIKKNQIDFLLQEFDSLIFANPGLLGNSDERIIHRISYKSGISLTKNIERAMKVTPFVFQKRWFNYDVI